MKRRHFMAGIGIGAMSLANASNVNRAAAYDTLINVPVNGDKDGHRSSKSVRIIGAGGAGCHLLTAMRTSGVLGVNGLRTELIAVDLCPHTLWHVEAANMAMPDRSPIQVIPIAENGSSRRVNAARAAALRHSESLKEAVTGVDVVILIAGLGSGTGSGVTPMLAGWSRAAGPQTIVVAVTPFNMWAFKQVPSWGRPGTSRWRWCSVMCVRCRSGRYRAYCDEDGWSRRPRLPFRGELLSRLFYATGCQPIVSQTEP